MATISPLFLLVLLLISVCRVHPSAAYSEDGFETDNHRVDAEQEPFTSVTLAGQAGDATSTLFRSCLATSRTIEAKFASIETHGGITYTRYVPDSNMLGFPVSWENAAGTVSNIFDCASAAEDGGYSMFKYRDNDCKLATMSYDLESVPECEDAETDAVFIKPAAPGSCVFPTLPVGAGNMCLLFTEKLMTFDAALSFCNSYRFMTLYHEAYDASVVSLADVIGKIQQLGYTKNMWVYAELVSIGWYGRFTVQDWVNGAVPTDGSVVGYLDSQTGWKLRGDQKSALAGAVCVLPDE